MRLYVPFGWLCSCLKTITFFVLLFGALIMLIFNLVALADYYGLIQLGVK